MCERILNLYDKQFQINKSTDRAKILQQSDSTSIIFTNYALKNNVYGFSNSFNISVS